jgi:hypothetical protein
MKKSVVLSLAVVLLLLAGRAAAGPGTAEKGKRFALAVNGGMSFIDGGDLNLMIRQTNLAVANIEDPNMTGTIAWKEFKGAPKIGAEIFYHISDRFALSLGFEVLKKKTVGSIGLDRAFTEDYDYGDSAEHVDFQSLSTILPENALTAVPLTLSVTYFIPAGHRGRAFVKAGIGYYMARLKSSYAFDSQTDYRIEEYYLGSLTDLYTEESTITSAYADTSKVNGLGFQGGLGFEFDLSKTLALVCEGGIRVADLRNWTGNGTQTSDYWARAGWQSSGLTEYSDSDRRDYKGELVYAPDAGLENGSLVLVENLDWGLEDARPAVIKLGGFTFRVGFLIRF